MPSPNPQAVEAALRTLHCGPDDQREAERLVQAAELHIRSQLLTELAEGLEEFANETAATGQALLLAGDKEADLAKEEARGHDAQGFLAEATGLRRAVHLCRELAAKEESE